MAVGTIQRSVLTDIANAIRVQNGGTDTYLPSEMAAAVLALDGTRAGTPLQATPGAGTGVISDSVFDGIAGAIRAQNGLSETYTPGEMAPAILALSWDVGVKMRAILLADGTLEFNYRDGRSSDVPGAVILDAWEVDPEGYSSAGARPWDDVKLSVTRVVFDGDFSEGGLANASYLFHGFENLVEVEGFEELSGATSMNQMFVSCASLETIWADGFTSSAASGSLMFSGCGRLVGGQGYVPGQMDDHGALSYGEDGVLTDPADDRREWFRCFLYADGGLVLTAATEPEAGRELVSSGRLCANARYNSVGYQPWYDHRHDVEAVEIAADMATYDHVNTNYWFYGHGGDRKRDGHGQPLRRARDAAHLQQLRGAHRDRPVRARPVLARGPRLHLRRVRLSRDDLGGRRLGAAVLRRLRLPDVLPVRLARGRGGHDLRELAGGLPVHEDRRRGRCRLPHREELLTGTPLDYAGDEPAVRAARGAGWDKSLGLPSYIMNALG